MARNIPDRWIPYKACGKVIEGTRIICFKVPLRKSVQTHVKEITEIWDIDALLAKIPNLGAVIDLTNTARYYDPTDLRSAGILHKKILMPGRIIPPENTVIEFMDAVDEFLGKNCDYLVGVHCTHGLNRTGYMVCRYMRDRLGIAAKDAIKRFERARGYQIERDNYIADLLGKKPPPPDEGVHTAVKPIHSRSDMSYRSPNFGYEEYDDNRGSRNNGRDRFGYSNRGSSSSGGGSGGRYNNCRRDSWGSQRRSETQDEREWTNSNRSYDYKYDY